MSSEARPISAAAERLYDAIEAIPRANGNGELIDRALSYVDRAAARAFDAIERLNKTRGTQ